MIRRERSRSTHWFDSCCELVRDLKDGLVRGSTEVQKEDTGVSDGDIGAELEVVERVSNDQVGEGVSNDQVEEGVSNDQVEEGLSSVRAAVRVTQTRAENEREDMSLEMNREIARRSSVEVLL